MDGAFIEWADAKVHVLTHSLHYGLAAFEGLRCYKGKSGSAIFKLQEHVDRLFESAHIGMMTIPYEKKQVADAIVDTVRINKLEACYIRPLVYIGYGPWACTRATIRSNWRLRLGSGGPIWAMMRSPTACAPASRRLRAITSTSR